MKTFLIVVAAVVVGLCLFAVLVWWWLRHKISGVVEAMSALAYAAPPPLRVTLESSTAAHDWGANVSTTFDELVALGYERSGDFTIPEMDDVAIRGFANAELGFYAAVYDHPQAGVIADLVCNLADHRHLTVSTAPDSGLQPPPSSTMVRLPLSPTNPGTVRELHERLRVEVNGAPSIGAKTQLFELAFTEAYRAEMDWRIGRRGPTPDEIRRVAELAGAELPDDNAIDMIRAMWQSAIDDLIEEEVREGYLADASVSAKDWEDQRERIYIVHEHVARETVVDILAWDMTGEEGEEGDEETLEQTQTAAIERLDAVFEGRDMRDGFARAQALLPAHRKYEWLGSVDQPWAADVYLIPEES